MIGWGTSTTPGVHYQEFSTFKIYDTLDIPTNSDGTLNISSIDPSQDNGTVTPHPPGAPSNLTANPGDSQVGLIWNAASNATSYKVYRNNTARPTNPTTTSYTDSGLTNGTTYTYQVSGVNADGEGPKSNSVSSTPVGVSQYKQNAFFVQGFLNALPSAPTGLVGTAGDTSAILTWNAPPSADNVTGWQLERNISPSNPDVPAVQFALAATPRTFTDTGLVNGQSYTYKIRAINANGISPDSTTVTVIPNPTFSANPTALSFSGTPGSTLSDQTITVSAPVPKGFAVTVKVNLT
jgi:hypothetical protein